MFSDADAASFHVAEADVAVRIGPACLPPRAISMPARILAAARATGAQAIHHGLWFSWRTRVLPRLALRRASPLSVRSRQYPRFGLKHTARALAPELRACRWAKGTELAGGWP